MQHFRSLREQLLLDLLEPGPGIGLVSQPKRKRRDGSERVTLCTHPPPPVALLQPRAWVFKYRSKHRSRSRSRDKDKDKDRIKVSLCGSVSPPTRTSRTYIESDHEARVHPPLSEEKEKENYKTKVVGIK